MKTNEILILLAAAAAAFFLLKKNAVAAVQPAGTSSLADMVSGIFNPAMAGDPGFGWQYFTNGTAIDPAGNYYFEGRKVWSAPQW
ncbi:MAG: hypothetical protein RugAbin2_02407 [Rugosibacter sp.]|nr:hypothetical protein [Rugosibacter sp.]